jgi:hypothetical protein
MMDFLTKDQQFKIGLKIPTSLQLQASIFPAQKLFLTELSKIQLNNTSKNSIKLKTNSKMIP